MGAGSVHVFNEPRPLRLSRAGVRDEHRPVVMVRRLGRSKSTDIDLALGLVPGRTGVVDKIVEMKVRWAITGGRMDLDGSGVLRDVHVADSGLAGIGPVATAEVWDVLDSMDVAAILAVMGGADPATVERDIASSTPEALALAEAEAQTGNSAPPPVGSTVGGEPSGSGSGSLTGAQGFGSSSATQRSTA